MSNQTTIAVNKESADQLRTLAKQKGVSQGVYIQKMMEFFIKNNIDYANGDAFLGSIVERQIERVVKILRAFEKEYFKVDNATLKELRESLLGVMSAASEEIGVVQQEQNLALQRQNDALNINYNELQKQAGQICQKIRAVLSDAKTTKKGVEIELYAAQKEALEVELNILIKRIYG